MRNPRSLFTCLLSSFATLTSTPGFAQVIPDTTLGTESSVVFTEQIVNGELTDVIGYGALRGGNLFHSFSDFNINELDRVYFFSPETVETIIGRVTGGEASAINGILGTVGPSNADLILINPNGLIFGQNARLDIQGSFAATTATGVLLGDQGSFGTAEPLNDNLLLVKPSAFFFNSDQETIQPNITVESQGANSLGLRVPNGESLLLLGGDVFVNGGYLNGWGGRIEIGAITGTGSVKFEDYSISASDDIQRGDIYISNRSSLDVQLSTGGDIKLLSNDINILLESQLLAGIESGFGTIESRSGIINLDATGSVNISSSNLINSVEADAVGQSGDLKIVADTVNIADGAQLNVGTSGIGDAGDVIIQAQNRVLFSGSSVSSFVDSNSEGQGGNIRIEASSLDVLDDSQINAATLGQGDAGNIYLDIRGTTRLEKMIPTNESSNGVFSSVFMGGSAMAVT